MVVNRAAGNVGFHRLTEPAAGIQRKEAGSATTRPVVHRQSPATEAHLAPGCQQVEIGKTRFKQRQR